MEIASDTYLKLYGLLFEKIWAKGYPKSKLKPSLKGVENATEIIKGKSKNISEQYLFCAFKYFVDRRTPTLKGLPTDIQDLRLVKAIEFINEVPESQSYSGEKWETEADRLITQFENAHKISRTKAVSETENSETFFLNIITTQESIFESPTIKSIAHSFFEHIGNNRLYDAWELLTPELKKNSIWNNELINFEITYSFFKLIESIKISNFSYQFQNVSFKVNLVTHVTTFNEDDLLNYSKKNSEEYMKLYSRYTFMRELIREDEKFKQDLQKMEESEKLSITSFKLNKKIHRKFEYDWKSMTFQQYYMTRAMNFNSKRLLSDRYFMWKRFIEEIRQDEQLVSLFMNFTCKFLYNRWLIDTIKVTDEVVIPS